MKLLKVDYLNEIPKKINNYTLINVINKKSFNEDTFIRLSKGYKYKVFRTIISSLDEISQDYNYGALYLILTD